MFCDIKIVFHVKAAYMLYLLMKKAIVSYD